MDKSIKKNTLSNYGFKFDKQKVFGNDWNYYDPHHHHHCHPDDQMGQTDTP